MEPGIYIDINDGHKIEVILCKDGVVYCTSLIDGHNFQALVSEVEKKWILESVMTEASNILFSDD